MLQVVLRSVSLVSVFAALAAATPASAALINFSFEGTIGSLSGPVGPNAFGLMVGDSISVTGTYDDSVIPGGTGTTSFALPGEGYVVTLGLLSLSSAAAGASSMTLSAGMLTDFGYFVISGPVTGVNFSGLSFSFSSGGHTIGGDGGLFGGFEADTFAIATPEPASLALAVAGFAGLLGFRRRRVASRPH